MSSRTSTIAVKCLGRFSRDADIDVFLHVLVKTNDGARDLSVARDDSLESVGSHFAVSIGAGPSTHRHPETGREVAYLHTGNTTPWTVIKRVQERRWFSGRLHKPPFVVIRRTSRPNDRQRAVASLVMGRRPVAVENHLIALTPRDGSLATCRALVSLCALPSITAHLNQHIRCRHLTIEVSLLCRGTRGSFASNVSRPVRSRLNCRCFDSSYCKHQRHGDLHSSALAHRIQSIFCPNASNSLA